MTAALHTSALTSLPLLARGKVRDNYAVGNDRILMVASDRISAFDVIMGEPIPGKGALLTRLSLFWFDQLGPKGLGICPIHLTGDAPESVVSPAEVPQVACFDTAFHRTNPPLAQMIALPKKLTDAGVRRYGFHGLSYEYIASTLSSAAPEIAGGRVIVAHLGNGASLCALREGHSIATTMGFTAADGLMMGLGFTLALVLLGGTREILGAGTLFAQASLLLGEGFAFMELTLIPAYKGYLLMALPPGGFLALGFLLAGKRVLDRRLARRAAAPTGEAARAAA